MRKKLTNLLTALSRYSSKPTNMPLENFCTELLGWCLQNSPCFLNIFLAPTRSNALKDYDCKELDIDTQRRFRLEPGGSVADLSAQSEEDQYAPSEQKQIVIPDMTIVSTSVPDIVILVESKVESDFGKDQLKKYLGILRSATFAEFKARFLISLTKYPADQVLNDLQEIKYLEIRWGDVYKILTTTEMEDEPLRFIRDQFADFLKQHDMQPLELPRATTDVLAGTIQGIDFRDKLETILRQVQQHPKLKDRFGRSRIVHELNNDQGWVDLGVYASARSLWAGFRFVKDPIGLHMVSSRPVAGDQTKWRPPSRDLAKILRPCYVGGETWLDFQQPVVPEFDGVPDRMVKWFVDTSLAARNLKIGAAR